MNSGIIHKSEIELKYLYKNDTLELEIIHENIIYKCCYAIVLQGNLKLKQVPQIIERMFNGVIMTTITLFKGKNLTLNLYNAALNKYFGNVELKFNAIESAKTIDEILNEFHNKIDYGIKCCCGNNVRFSEIRLCNLCKKESCLNCVGSNCHKLEIIRFNCYGTKIITAITKFNESMIGGYLYNKGTYKIIYVHDNVMLLDKKYTFYRPDETIQPDEALICYHI